MIWPDTLVSESVANGRANGLLRSTLGDRCIRVGDCIFRIRLYADRAIRGGTISGYFGPQHDGRRPVDLAIFMSWDFSAVLIRAWCDAGKELVMQYAIDDAIPNDNQFRMAIILDQQSHMMETTTMGLGRVLEGRIDLTPTLSSSIRAARNVDIDVPNEMGEPLYTGSAYPLKRIIEGCQS